MHLLRPLACSLILAAALAACAHDPPASLPLTELARGAFCQVKVARREVVRDQAGWDRLRAEMGVSQPAPPVDFEGQMVIAAFMGERRSGGYSVQIVSVALDGDALVVTVREKGPEPGAMVPQALTQPFHVVRVARTTLPVRWVDAG